MEHEGPRRRRLTTLRTEGHSWASVRAQSQRVREPCAASHCLRELRKDPWPLRSCIQSSGPRVVMDKNHKTLLRCSPIGQVGPSCPLIGCPPPAQTSALCSNAHSHGVSTWVSAAGCSTSRRPRVGLADYPGAAHLGEHTPHQAWGGGIFRGF